MKRFDIRLCFTLLVLVVFLLWLSFPIQRSMVHADTLIGINETNFPDSNFRSVIANYDNDGDGSLNYSEIQGITRISVATSNITTVQGIEFFPELTYLNCNNNQITSINVSCNPKLTWLSCFYNNISTLDITGCPNLNNLYYNGTANTGTSTVTYTGKVNGYFCNLGYDLATTIISDPNLDPADPSVECVDMYRLYNPNSGEHFYTSATGERDNLINVGWTYEGVGWQAPASSNTPVYRLYNQYGGEHHYTTSMSERDFLIANGWTYESIGWYSDDARTVPLYRQYNPNAFSNNHNYTTSLGENDWLVSIGWQAEGVGWYGVG